MGTYNRPTRKMDANSRQAQRGEKETLHSLNKQVLDKKISSNINSDNHLKKEQPISRIGAKKNSTETVKQNRNHQTDYFFALYLGMYITPISPKQLPDDAWNSLLETKDHNKVTLLFLKKGLIKETSQLGAESPVYECTEKGRAICKENLGVDYEKILGRLDNNQKSILRKAAEWFLGAVAAGIIGNRADSLFLELEKTIQMLVKNIIHIATQLPIKKPLTLTNG